MATTLALVLGDQLSFDLSCIGAPDQTDILMAEVADEAQYVPHHPKKIALIFSAMRHFAQALRERGYRVHYHAYQVNGPRSIVAVLDSYRDQYDQIQATHCGEYRLQQQLEQAGLTLLPDTRFLATLEQFRGWADGRKQLRMEFFYREMRKQYGLLMEGDQPTGGQWNFDADNREKYTGDPSDGPMRFEPDAITQEVLERVGQQFPAHFGTLDNYWFGATHADAERAFEHFIQTQLPDFGRYQDAMRQDDDWLFHSCISIYLNIGLLNPLDLCRRAEMEYRTGRAPINAVEGFIRQILGWREYVRGIYWLCMPEYAELNGLDAQRTLPDFYWDETKTEMNCVRQAVRLTRQEAWSHHILRLMVTGNLALLLGVAPKHLAHWYLAVYADAFEWVELPNVLGMVSHADGGYLGSKPYAASGKYISRQGDYCDHCRYSPKQDVGPKACPMNALYWDFIARHEDKFARHPRMAMMYRTWARMKPEKREALLAQAQQTLASIYGEPAGDIPVLELS
ncbi:MAG: cryptochrome/photolyase family protein [Litorivicinus sp.]